MKAPTGKLALAYRSLAVAEEKAERLMAERDALQALLNKRDAEIDGLQALSVSHILLRVDPGPDGMGVEVYASSVAQVIEALDEAWDRVEVPQGQLYDERAAFEDWCAGQYGLSLAPKQHPLRGVLEPRSYQQPAVQMAWVGWQARAAIK